MVHAYQNSQRVAWALWKPSSFRNPWLRAHIHHEVHALVSKLCWTSTCSFNTSWTAAIANFCETSIRCAIASGRSLHEHWDGFYQAAIAATDFKPTSQELLASALCEMSSCRGSSQLKLYWNACIDIANTFCLRIRVKRGSPEYEKAGNESTIDATRSAANTMCALLLAMAPELLIRLTSTSLASTPLSQGDMMNDHMDARLARHSF
jgi:hypothetical protein